MKNNLKFILILLAVFSQCIQAKNSAADLNKVTKPPNLIIILTDDQGYKDVGFNGSTDIKTPNIDIIAKEGTRFTNGYVSYPVCGPSRAGLLTGRYQDRFGFVGNPTIDPTVDNAGIPKTEKNIAEVLKPAGYTSGILGKWHMGTHPDLHPNKRGFDHFFGFLSGGHQYFAEDLTINDLSQVTRKWQWYRTRLLRNNTRVDTTEYLTDELSNEAVDFIKREKDNPFFLYVAYNAPHTPLQASKKYLDRYPHIKNKKRKTYAAMVSAVDDGVGQILLTLKKQGIDDNTIIFFLSDNGGAKNNASDNGELRGGKTDPFEGGVRVPFAVRWPSKIPAGIDYHKAVSSLDILATIVGEANVDISNNKSLDGVNLIPYLTGENKGQPHDVLFWRSFDTGWAASLANNSKMIKTKGEAMLFDLNDDMGEKNNLLKKNNEQNKNQYKKQRTQYQQWNEELQVPAFPRLGSWDFTNQNTNKIKKEKTK